MRTFKTIKAKSGYEDFIVNLDNITAIEFCDSVFSQGKGIKVHFVNNNLMFFTETSHDIDQFIEYITEFLFN